MKLRTALFLCLALGACKRAPEEPAPPVRSDSGSAGATASTSGASTAPSSAPSVAVDAAPAAPTPVRGWKCPDDMVATRTGVCVDKYEASGDGGELGKADGSGTAAKARSVAGAMPLVNVSVAQARKACLNAGKHLCTDVEWMAACTGGTARKYAYGDDYEAARCNDYTGSKQGTAGVVATGSFARCMSAEGAFDLNNNVGEWVDGAGRSGQQLIRGGTLYLALHDSECGEDDVLLPPDAQRPFIGFRCCRAADKE